MGAWIEIPRHRRNLGCQSVAPHVGAWIEIALKRVLRDGVGVAPHVGAWIEISPFCRRPRRSSSHPTWVRGLKLERVDTLTIRDSRTPRGCVD